MGESDHVLTASEEPLARLRAIKAAHEAALLRKANVIGVGIGPRLRGGRPTGELAIVVSVTEKIAPQRLAARDVLPRELDGVPVDVQVLGELRAL